MQSNTIKKTTLYFFLISIFFSSCGASGARLGGKALQNIVKSFAKNAGKNSSKLLRFKGGTRTAVTKNGRLVPYNQIAKFNKVQIPSPKNIHIIRNSVNDGGTQLASSTVKGSKVDLVLYDAVGNPIIYANSTQNYLVYNAAQRAYQTKTIHLVDDVLRTVKNTKITSDAQLQKVINETVTKRLGTASAENPVIMDVTTGNLTFNVEFFNGSQIVGNINIYNTIKKGVIVGASGYYVLKKK